ncbi:MAG: hypothetical protein WCF90_05665 [Methanomicrobiales archaeon]
MLKATVVHIAGSTERMFYYDILEPDAHKIALSKMISLSVTELLEAIRRIRTMKDPERIEKHCLEVSQFRHLAHDLLIRSRSDPERGCDAGQQVQGYL